MLNQCILRLHFVLLIPADFALSVMAQSEVAGYKVDLDGGGTYLALELFDRCLKP